MIQICTMHLVQSETAVKAQVVVKHEQNGNDPSFMERLFATI